MGDDQRRTSILGLLDRVHDFALVLCVEGGCALVEDEQAGVADESTGDRDALRLTTRDETGVFTDKGFVAFREGHDKVMDVGLLGGTLNLLAGDDGRSTIADIVLDRGGKEVRVLGNDSNVFSQPDDVSVVQAVSIDADESSVGLVQSLQESGDGRLAGSGGTDEGNAFVGFDLEAHVAENRDFWPGRVCERNIVEANWTLDTPPVRALGFLGILVQLAWEYILNFNTLLTKVKHLSADSERKGDQV
ncbi:10157_t:CDS:2, partial [Acaulospora colombiana]